MRTSCVRTLQPGQKIRVLVVDDSVVIRKLVANTLGSDPGIEVVGVAAHGGLALQRIPQLNPDVITLDMEMPEMDGIATLGHLRREHPQVRVVMLSTLTHRGAEATIQALAAGAHDYVAKPSNCGGVAGAIDFLRAELIPKVKQFFTQQIAVPLPRRTATLPLRRVQAPQVLGIGVSTGGPAALGKLLPEFPHDFPLPILVVQHMPPLFTQLLAERLNASCALAVREARDGEVVEGGSVLIAPGDFHLAVAQERGRVVVRLDQSAPQNSCRPAVDALFGSLSEVYGRSATAVVLTGMGQDGLRGATAVRANGGYVIAQDETSSVVWGMPGSLVKASVTDAVLPLEQIAPAIRQQVETCPRREGSSWVA